MNPPAEKRVRLTLQYDGGGFRGWQVQPGGRTVQGVLEEALLRLLSTSVRVAAAGRTDAGVHATGQVVTLDVPERWTATELRRALNATLPSDMWVEAAAEAAPRFHARFDAGSRGYEYRVGLTEQARSPFHRRWCWPLGIDLDRALLQTAADEIVGERSFRAFAKVGQEHRGDRCIVHRSEWHDWPPTGVRYEVQANRFLHHMVRYLVGTMVDIARGRRPLEDMRGLLEGIPGVVTSPPAPPEGLFLTNVEYPANPDPGDTEA